MTKIEWTDAVWNPVVGCTKVSRGCKHCYAEVQARRFMGIDNFSAGDRSIQHVFLKPERLDKPLHWKKPRRVFVNSMSDLFHEDVPEQFIAAVFGVMARARQHTFQVLTKRPQRMLAWLQSATPAECLASLGAEWPPAYTRPLTSEEAWTAGKRWPLPNVWLGVSVEDQRTADERIPLLLDTPVAVRFISYEPALGPVDFRPFLPCPHDPVNCFTDPTPPQQCAECTLNRPGLNWVIIGGESGPRARPFDLAWARNTIVQCKAASVPVFVKQMGSMPYELSGDHLMSNGKPPVGCYLALGGDMSEWPPELRVREFPEEAQV